MFEQAVVNVTNVTFLTLFKSLSLERKGPVSPFHCWSTCVYLWVNFLLLKPLWCGGCFSHITSDTSWWRSSDCHPIFFPLIFWFAEGNGTAALSHQFLISGGSEPLSVCWSPFVCWQYCLTMRAAALAILSYTTSFKNDFVLSYCLSNLREPGSVRCVLLHADLTGYLLSTELL